MLRRIAALICLIPLALASAPAPATAQPAGFTEQVLPGLGSLAQPTAFAFLPDASLLIATKSGQLRLYTGGALRTAPVFDRVASICSNSERGLLGVAVDPAFATNSRIYVYYTFDKHATKGDQDPNNNCPTNSATDPVNRVSRLTLSAGLTVADEFVLVDNIPSPNGNHNAGDLQFGNDGLLYISTGDGGRNDTARQRNNLDGSILRITGDGTIPLGNPYTGADSARCYDPADGGNKTGSVAANLRCQELFAWGLRNPFRIAFDPNSASARFFVNDVGEGNAEEISEAGPGVDFGWNCYEGTRLRKTDGVCNPTPQGSRAPYFEYQRGPALPGQAAFFDGCRSITAGAFVPAGLWPSEYDGDYLFADIVCSRLFSLSPGAGAPTPALFLSGRSITHMAFGPLGAGQALYVADYGAGTIRTLSYTGGANRSPRAALTADRSAGAAPLSVSFDAAGSSDLDGETDIVAYLWSFGDGQTAETTVPNVTHTYNRAGNFTATVRVRDSAGAVSFTAAAVQLSIGANPEAPGPGPVYLPFIYRS